MSTDGTREIIREYRQSHPNIHLIDNHGKIVPTGMNAALRVAKGDFIIRVDGHCIISVDYISKCVQHLELDGVDGVGGPMETIGETALSETIAVAMSSSFGVGNSAFRTITGKTLLVDTVPFPAFTRMMIEKAGFYDEELVRDQDDEYNYRVRELGGKLLLAADIKSKYYSRGSLAKLWKQYFQYGYWKVRVLQKHPRQMSVRQFVPPLFVLSLIISILLVLLTPWGKWILLLVAGSYLAANLTASVLTAAKKGWGHLPLLPLTFLILHLSYGLGFLTGLIKFWKRWGDKTGRVPSY
jgi:glycosyltransferase involved in cell wall biosynthesis